MLQEELLYVNCMK